MKVFFLLTTLLVSVFAVNYSFFGEKNTTIPKHIEKKVGNAGCLILNQDKKILMAVNAKTGKFSIPGGTSEVGETAIQTAERETFEEVGSKVKVVAFVREAENGFFYFICELSDKKLNHSHKFVDEISGNEWVDLSKVERGKLRFPEEYLNLQQILKDGGFY